MPESESPKSLPKVMVAPELLADARPPASRAARALGVGVAVLALLAAALFGAVQYRRHGPAGQLLIHGQEELAAGRFDEAANALRLAREQGAEPEAVAPLLDAALAGQRDAARLAEARKAIAEHRFDDARVALQGIPAGSHVREAAASVAGQIEPARTQFLFSSAREALARGDVAKARALQKEVAALEPALSHQLALDIANASGGAELNLPAISLGLDRLGPDPLVRKALAAAFKDFDQGEVSAAAKGFAAAGNSHPDGTIRAAARALALGAGSCGQALGAKSSSSAELLMAARACADVDPDGAPVRTLRARLAQAYDGDAKARLSEGKLLDALTAYRSAVAANASDPGARAGLDALRAQAPALAEKARAARGEPSSSEIWQLLAALLAPDDALRGEALQALGN